MSETPVLRAHVVRRIHAGLTLDVELELGREFGVVFGASGAGKTSLLRLIAGLDTPAAGYVRVGDAVLFDVDRGIRVPLRRRRIGMIFQDDLLFPHLNVRDNIRFGLRPSSGQAAEKRLSEVASLCGVEKLLNRRPETLSGGERQRVGLARALAPRPRLLLCDEPVSAIDLEGRAALVERLRAIVRTEEIPALYVTHSPGEAVAVGSKLFLIANGRLLDQGAPLDVLANVRRESAGWFEGVRNTFHAIVVAHQVEAGETLLRIVDGPDLIVPHNGRLVGATVSVAIRADDVLLALGPVEGLSARNRIHGVVDRVIARGAESEVVVQSGRSLWLASVVASAVSALGLARGVEVRMIVKARSCHVLGGDDA